MGAVEFGPRLPPMKKCYLRCLQQLPRPCSINAIRSSAPLPISSGIISANLWVAPGKGFAAIGSKLRASSDLLRQSYDSAMGTPRTCLPCAGAGDGHGAAACAVFRVEDTES